MAPALPLLVEAVPLVVLRHLSGLSAASKAVFDPKRRSKCSNAASLTV
jgi:hypothetical protein